MTTRPPGELGARVAVWTVGNLFAQTHKSDMAIQDPDGTWEHGPGLDLDLGIGGSTVYEFFVVHTAYE